VISDEAWRVKDRETMAGRHFVASVLRLLLLYTSLSCVDLRRLRSGKMRICFHFLYVEALKSFKSSLTLSDLSEFFYANKLCYALTAIHFSYTL